MTLDELLQQAKAIPSIPRVVSEVNAELDRDDPDPRRIAERVATDPGMTARLLKLANSAFFGLTRQIDSVDEAIAVLGFNHLRTLVQAVALGSSFKSVPGVNLEQFWRYSLNTAKICRPLARSLKLPDGAAFTAGLVHAVGELVMHMGMPDVVAKIDWGVSPFDMKRAEVERSVLGYTYADVSAAFAERWDFPPVIATALKHQLVPFEGDIYEPLAGVVHMASWRARAQEMNLDREAMAATFPDVVAILLGLSLDMVLDKDPQEWTSAGELAAFLH
ncbi:HDOD domain-containing protein [Tepidimonas taiwanensis]|uniref:HDOD domain protein n=1 Tax=Tepidimonas taiwanensis TaxID=307486 RepID=A0A554X9E4_9BURK|nr:HDOD domain-containing protein [Tepidimonas taiwanensis]MCX7692005.1 HDOD domain-containing protein [Tepidimonas taiwanensis]MDM7462440.1 HDOD domain-containing protein [Tepidimonas taiwanensis]TSE32437.1 HDOD domain protein [Tepidimonas taiwanensis]UBQ06614.1 HDOD domain-containing protein [Tepidimonas taiwanensis]